MFNNTYNAYHPSYIKLHKNSYLNSKFNLPPTTYNSHATSYRIMQHHPQSAQNYGAPDRIRTCDPRLRRPVLYPTELRAQFIYCSTSRKVPASHPWSSVSRPKPPVLAFSRHEAALREIPVLTQLSYGRSSYTVPLAAKFLLAILGALYPGQNLLFWRHKPSM
jgi:hypothetical protein